MMNKKLTGIAVGASLIIGGGTVDLVPVERPATSWIQYHVSEYTGYATVLTATGTQKIINPIPLFKDGNKDDIISVAISHDKKGNEIYSQISEEAYANLGKKDGYKFNSRYPVIEKITLAEYTLEQIIPVAEASIAFDTSARASTGSASSLTLPHTVTGSNPVIVTSVLSNSTPTGVTYGGTAVTFIDSVAAAGSTEYLYYLTNCATGLNNIVVTMAGATYIYINSASYTGVDNVAYDVTGKVSSTVVTQSVAVTTTTNNDWIIGAAWFGDVISSSNGTLRHTTSPNPNYQMADIAAPTAGSNSLSMTQNSSTFAALIVVALKPFTGGGGGTVAPIIQPIITWW